jgi:TPR repeat protein
MINAVANFSQRLRAQTTKRSEKIETTNDRKRSIVKRSQQSETIETKTAFDRADLTSFSRPSCHSRRNRYPVLRRSILNKPSITTLFFSLFTFAFLLISPLFASDPRLQEYADGVMLEKASEKGDKNAPFLLGNMYVDRIKDYDKAFYWYKVGYNRGNKDCAYAIGDVYYWKLNDPESARKWFNIGYKMGSAESAYGLGIINRDAKDYPKAIEWYEISYKMGLVEAAYALGLLYGYILKDYPKAIEWYTIAYNKKHSEAAYALGLLYKNTLKDYPKAIEWYEKAHNKQHGGAANSLGILYEDIKDYPKAIEWYQIAHKMGNQYAPLNLGLLYKDALQDYEKAIKWFQISYDINKHYGSLYWIAVIHRDGLGVKKDLVKARSLFQEIANNGVGEAKKLSKQALLALDSAKSQ